MPHGVRSTYPNITRIRLRATQGAANVVENHGRITGIGFFSHAVAETNDDLAALIGAAHSVEGPGLLLPLRNTELLRSCLERGLRVVHTMNLMTIGQYQSRRHPIWRR